jgi:hypothetical protein
MLSEKTRSELIKYKEANKDCKIRPIFGSLESKFIVLAPAPCPEEIKRKFPLSSNGAVWATNLFREHGIVFNRDATVICPCPVGAPSKTASYAKGTALLRSIYRDLTDFPCLCFGSNNFKFLFGEGRKASDSSLSGNTIYNTWLGSSPLVYLSDPAFLGWPNEEDFTEVFQFRRACDSVLLRRSLFKTHVNKVVPVLERYLK